MTGETQMHTPPTSELRPEQILSDLIRIDTVNPPGNETAVALYLKELFARFGVSAEIIESEPGRGSFIASTGEGPRKLLYLSHTDVVPFGDGWSFDPLSGEIRDGYVLGRGALDCKGLVATQACAFLSLALEGKLAGRLIFAATADEEKGGKKGIRYILQNCPEKVLADFAVTEGAEEPARLPARTPGTVLDTPGAARDKSIYFIQAGEKGTAWSRISARGVSCHGSVPTLGDNAVTRVARAIARLDDYAGEVVVIPQVKRLLEELARVVGMPTLPGENVGWSFENVDELIRSVEEEFGDKAFAEALRSMTRMTVSPNVIQGGNKINVVPDSCWAEIDIRVLPGQEVPYVRSELERYLPPGISLEIFGFHPPTFSTIESEHYRAIEATLKEVTGTAICLPHISPGATDSRFLREAGVPCYGVNVMSEDFDPGLKCSVHGKDEQIDVRSLYLETQFFISLAKRYLGSESSASEGVPSRRPGTSG